MSNCQQKDRNCEEELQYLHYRILNYQKLFDNMHLLEGSEYSIIGDAHIEYTTTTREKYSLVYHCANVDFSKFEENYELLLDVKENLADTTLSVVLITSFQNYRLIKPRLNKKVQVGYIDRFLDKDSIGLFKQDFICVLDNNNIVRQPFFMDQMTKENIASYLNTIAQRYTKIPGYRFVKESQAVIIDKKQNRKGPIFNVEISDTPYTRQLGLMYRKSLSENSSMKFVFSPPVKIGFWMKNTIIPLDIVYLNEKNEIIEIFKDVKPFSTEILHSNDKVAFVYEFNAGFVSKNSIGIGDRIIYVKEVL